MKKIAFDCWGVRFSLEWEQECLDQDLADLQVATWLPIPPESADHVFSIEGDGDKGWEVKGPDQEWAAPSRQEWLASLERRISIFVATHAREAAFIHAGCVVCNGLGVLLAGPSHAGKSTLVYELVRRGAQYFSDEYAILDRPGQVHPYPRRLSLRGPGGGEERLAMPRLPDFQPVPVGMVLNCRYQPTALWCPQRISAGLGCLHLTQNAVAAIHSPALVLQCISQTARSSQCWEGTRSQAGPVADWIFDQLR